MLEEYIKGNPKEVSRKKITVQLKVKMVPSGGRGVGGGTDVRRI